MDDLGGDAVHAAFLRSAHAHARIRAIDAEAARRMDGVLAVYTLADLPATAREPLPILYPNAAITQPQTPPPLAGEACYVGQPLVMVVAETRAIAEDAIDTIEVGYDLLPVAIDLAETAAGRQGPAHDGAADSIAAHYSDECGDVEEAMRTADHVLELVVVAERASGQPLEGRGVVARWDADTGRLAVTDSTQLPLQVRVLLARALGLDLDHIDVHSPDLGGGFGTKSFRLYPEEVLVPFAAMRLARPVKWIEDRAEHLLAAAHQRSQIHQVRLGVGRDGRIRALDVEFLHDMGAYCQFGLLIPLVTASGLAGPYAIGNVRVRFRAVYTNTVQVSPYRGSSAPFSTFVMERAIDHVARALGLDRALVRRRNFVPRDAFPHDTGLRAAFGDGTVTYDSGDYSGGLEAVLTAIGWRDFPEAKARAAGQGRLLGIGLAAYVEATGIGPYESARVRIDPNGSVQVAVGSPSSGQGHETVLAAVAGRVLGVDPERVVVTGGDSRQIPYGYGTYGSRTAVVCGNAVLLAARAVAGQALALAAATLRVPADELVLDEGLVRHTGDPHRAIPLAVLAQIAVAAPPPPGADPGLSALRTYVPRTTPYASGAHACVVEVDPATFDMRILRYVAQHDCGPVLNPMIVEGQVVGGVAHGIAETFYERRVYDPSGRPVTRNFHDYLMPYATEIPRVELLHAETPAPGNELGVKGAGEAGIIPVSAAIISALEDAVGVVINRTPMTPQELFHASARC
ncbi:xanthine dehydrogenase family protein molybdopterin-binding subunit [Nonomuraea monospora]|uniref:Xanthine dehydrogenase family protein molybdopterin-binding subunit n=1 Tax=Nonomuraea monospora TaxID=568818 RepID=A0ABP5PX45_9ACTN